MENLKNLSENDSPNGISDSAVPLSPKDANHLKAELKKELVNDSNLARLARFAAGSVFGIVFLVICFLLLTTALKGPDTVKVDGVTLSAGLVPGQKLPANRLNIGDPAPDFVLKQLGGDPVQLSKLQGKTVLINFWASWCQPCIEEMPYLQQLYLKNRNGNLQILEVNYREGAEVVKAFFKDHNLTMPVLLDTDGKVTGGYKVPQFPESYFVDRNGIVQEEALGAMTFAEMENKLAKVWEVSGKSRE